MVIASYVKHTIIALVIMTGSVVLLSPLPAAQAACANPKSCLTAGVAGAGGDTAGNSDIGPLIKNIVNALLYVLGAVAVVMIVIGGLKYVTSNGDSSSITSAKNTILYSVIGLVVAIMAYAIVNFVITSVG